MDWHSFATIREPGTKGYSMVVSRAGDWTNKNINDPVTKIWVRGIPTFGVVSFSTNGHLPLSDLF
jgi:hypothetical protein